MEIKTIIDNLLSNKFKFHPVIYQYNYNKHLIKKYLFILGNEKIIYTWYMVRKLDNSIKSPSIFLKTENILYGEIDFKEFNHLSIKFDFVKFSTIEEKRIFPVLKNEIKFINKTFLRSLKIKNLLN